jgi:hypothetical protein
MSDPYGGKSLWHTITCPLATRWRERRYHQPPWRLDKTAQMLGVSSYGCPRCGRGAIAYRPGDTGTKNGDGHE